MELTTQSFLILILGLIVVALIIVLLKQNIKKFDFKLLKGLLSFSGETHKNIVKVEKENNEAKTVLEWVQKNINKVDGDYILTETINENAQIAARLYSKLNGDIIATCFFDEPDYGNGDFANTISPGTNFSRITTESLCPEEKATVLRLRLKKFVCNSSLVVIPNGIEITKIAGIFCKLPDKSYISFIALNNYGAKQLNKGLTFTGDLAEKLYEYYKSFIQ